MNKIDPINLSPSFLGQVLSHGYDYAVAQKLGIIPSLPTQAMIDGKLMHALLAERLGVQSDKWVISPYDSFRTNESKAWRDSQPDNIMIVKEKTVDEFSIIADRVIAHPEIKLLLEDAQAENMIEKQVKDFNIKGILDVLSASKGTTVIDWKLVSSKNFDNFKREALYSNYDLQAAVYDFLVEATHVYFVAIESQAPHRIKLFYCTSSFLESGAEKFDKALKIIHKENWRKPNFDIMEIEDLVSWNHYEG